MKKFLKRMVTPPAVIKYGDEMSPAARKRVTRDLIWAGVIASAYAVYNIYLQNKLADAELAELRTAHQSFRANDPFVGTDSDDAYHHRPSDDEDDFVPLYMRCIIPGCEEPQKPSDSSFCGFHGYEDLPPSLK